MANKRGFLIIGIILVLLSSISYADEIIENTDLKISNIRLIDEYLTAGQSSSMIFTLKNNADEKLKDLDIDVILFPYYDKIGLPEEIDIKAGERENIWITLDVPSYIEPGYYLIKISIANSKINRIKIVEVYIK